MRKFSVNLNNFESTLYATLAVICFGPVIILACIVTGGNPLDGFAAGFYNAQWQTTMIEFGYKATAVLGVIAFIATTILAIKKFKHNKMFALLPLICIGVPVGAAIGLAVFGIVASFMFRVLWHFILTPFR